MSKKDWKSDSPEAVKQRVLRWRKDFGVRRITHQGTKKWVMKEMDEQVRKHIKAHEVALAYFVIAQRNGHIEPAEA